MSLFGHGSHDHLYGSHLNPLQTLILDITNPNSTWPIANKPPLRPLIPTQHPFQNPPSNNLRNPSIRHVKRNRMPQPMIPLPSRRPPRQTPIIPLPIRIRNIPWPAQKIENRLPDPPSNSLARRSIQLPTVENRQMPYAWIVDSGGVGFQAAAALAPDADARGVDVRPGAFAGVGVDPVYGGAEGGGVFA